MTPEDLKALTTGVIAAGLTRVVLNVPSGWRRPPGMPIPELLSVDPNDGSLNLSFDARRFDRYLTGLGFS